MANTGNAQNVIDVVDAGDFGDFDGDDGFFFEEDDLFFRDLNGDVEFEEVGPTIELSPTQMITGDQQVNQAASAFGW